jgi:hypothetical protein
MQQQPLYPSSRSTAGALPGKTVFAWSDPAQIMANQGGMVTPEQRRMLGQLSFGLAGGLALFGLLGAGIAVMLALGLQNGLFLAITLVPLALAVVAVIVPLRGRNRLLQAADARQIERGQGEVVWDQKKSNYIARTPNRQLTTARSSLSLPPPGPYHFYYLAESGVLLSARPIHTHTGALAFPDLLAATGLPGDEQAILALQQALCQALSFDMGDLAYNRQGMLSGRQRRQASRKVFWGTVGSIIILPVGLGILVASIVYPLMHHEAIFVGCFGFVGLLMFLGALYGVTAGRRKQFAELSGGVIQQVDGVIQPREVGGGEDSTSYYYDIDKRSFSVSSAAHQALVRELRYRVYYLASLDLLLSVEPLEAPRR